MNSKKDSQPEGTIVADSTSRLEKFYNDLLNVHPSSNLKGN